MGFEVRTHTDTELACTLAMTSRQAGGSPRHAEPCTWVGLNFLSTLGSAVVMPPLPKHREPVNPARGRARDSGGFLGRRLVPLPAQATLPLFPLLSLFHSHSPSHASSGLPHCPAWGPCADRLGNKRTEEAHRVGASSFRKAERRH